MDEDTAASTPWTPTLLTRICSEARTAGFDLAGVAAAPTSDDPAGTATAQRFTSWIDQGRAGEMQYLARRSESGQLLRESARSAMPWARSVLVCALNYNLAGPSGPAPRSLDTAPPDRGWIARYAWTGGPHGEPLDYHDDLLRRLRQVESTLQSIAPCQSRCYVDTGPLLERDFAARAGIGWIGKNTCVLNQQLGSWLLLGVIVTSLELDTKAYAPLSAVSSLRMRPDAHPVSNDESTSFSSFRSEAEQSASPTPSSLLTLAPDRCGSCTRCIDACPTQALIEPLTGVREMDATRCIAYLTIEKKGDIPEELRAPIGRNVFGCDICQEVCPWNRKAPESTPAGLTRREDLMNPSLQLLAGLDGPAFNRLFRGSPLERTRRKRILRNVAVAMGNSADPTFLPQLEAWTGQSEDLTLQQHAAWAITRLQRTAANPAPEPDHA